MPAGRLVFALAMVAAALFLSPIAAAESRVALVVGNGAYQAAGKLANPGADARLVSQSLRRAGFETIDLRQDLGRQDLVRALVDFRRKADAADVALIYYAGHGIEVGGRNWLIPVDARLADERDLEVEALELNTLLTAVEGARAIRIVILDACRDNPFARSMRRINANRAIGRGLADVEISDTLVVYAARGGTTASDGEGAHGPFAEALAKRLPEPGVDIQIIFRKVRDDVLRATNNRQEPFQYGSLRGEQLFLVPPTSAAPPIAAPGPVGGPDQEVVAFNAAVTINSIAAFEDYLKRFPKGANAVLAREALARLRQPPPPVSAVSSGPARPATPASKGGTDQSRFAARPDFLPLEALLASADEGKQFCENFRARDKSCTSLVRLGRNADGSISYIERERLQLLLWVMEGEMVMRARAEGDFLCIAADDIQFRMLENTMPDPATAQKLVDDSVEAARARLRSFGGKACMGAAGAHAQFTTETFDARGSILPPPPDAPKGPRLTTAVAGGQVKLRNAQ
jgi:hypothetical protein